MRNKCLLLCFALFLCLLVAGGTAQAQKNDLSLTAGGYFTSDNPFNIGTAWALEGSYARRMFSVPFVSLSGELPVAESFKSSIPNLSGTTLIRSYSSLFITPGLRLRLAPSFPLSPYVAAGVGYARFNRKLNDGTTSPYDSLAADLAGGIDVKVFPFISIRGEVRDFNTSNFSVQSLLSGGRQNNIFLTLGLSLKF
jgi:Outer membrane protein beta-barrel domain